MLYAKPVGEFILRHPALKVLILSFLVTIGVTLCLEAFHTHIPKAYVYLPMGFALGVELLQIRMDANRCSRNPPATPQKQIRGYFSSD